jgi:hypothetical protein
VAQVEIGVQNMNGRKYILRLNITKLLLICLNRFEQNL